MVDAVERSIYRAQWTEGFSRIGYRGEGGNYRCELGGIYFASQLRQGPAAVSELVISCYKNAESAQKD